MSRFVSTNSNESIGEGLFAKVDIGPDTVLTKFIGNNSFVN
jgi:hypothetical protein